MLVQGNEKNKILSLPTITDIDMISMLHSRSLMNYLKTPTPHFHFLFKYLKEEGGKRKECSASNGGRLARRDPPSKRMRSELNGLSRPVLPLLLSLCTALLWMSGYRERVGRHGDSP